MAASLSHPLPTGQWEHAQKAHNDAKATMMQNTAEGSVPSTDAEWISQLTCYWYKGIQRLGWTSGPTNEQSLGQLPPLYAWFLNSGI